MITCGDDSRKGNGFVGDAHRPLLSSYPHPCIWCCRQRNVCHTISILFCICHLCSVWQWLLRKTCINSFHVHVVGLCQWTSCTSSYKGADTRPASALMFLHNHVQLSSHNGLSPGVSSTLLRVCREIQQPFLDGSSLNGLGCYIPAATSTTKDTSSSQNWRKFSQVEWGERSGLWPAPTKPFPLWQLSSWLFSAPVVTFIGTKTD